MGRKTKQKYKLELCKISYDRGMIIRPSISANGAPKCSRALKNMESKSGKYDNTLPRAHPLQVLQEDCRFKGLDSLGIPDSSHE